MELNEYQTRASKTAIYPTYKAKEYTIIGLCGEAGELANKYKKVMRGDKDLVAVREDILTELGGVLWYVAMIAAEFGFSLDRVAEANLTKLESRKERGVIQGDGDNRQKDKIMPWWILAAVTMQYFAYAIWHACVSTNHPVAGFCLFFFYGCANIAAIFLLK